MSDLFFDKTLLKKTSKIAAAIESQGDPCVETECVDAKEALKEKVVCLFFSASWCIPCHHFVPLLKDVYTELIKRGDPLEVVFVSCDKSEEDMLNYYATHQGNWLALPFGDPFRDTLVEQYSINMVPKLIVIHPNGEVITMRGRKDIQDKGVICMRGWQTALVRAMGNTADAEEVQDLS